MEKQGFRENIEMISTLYPGRLTLSVNEVAAIMAVDTKTVYSAINRTYNPLPAKRLTKGKIVISVPLLARWLA